jgi:hypothetical protein
LCEGNLIGEAAELVEAAPLEPFGAVAIEVISTEFTISGRLCHRGVSNLENMAADREHCPSMPQSCARATIVSAQGGVLGAAGSSTGFRQRGTQTAIVSGTQSSSQLQVPLTVATFVRSGATHIIRLRHTCFGTILAGHCRG